MEENSLAYEMLKEIKSSRGNIFAIAVIEAIIIAILIAILTVGFFIYESQFDYETSVEQNQKVEDIDTSDVIQTIN